jgi:hypothetical protein
MPVGAIAQAALATYSAGRPQQGVVTAAPMLAGSGASAVAGASGSAAAANPNGEALGPKPVELAAAALARRGGDDTARLLLVQPLATAPETDAALVMTDSQGGPEATGPAPLLAPLAPRSERVPGPGAAAGARSAPGDAALAEMQALIDRIATWTQALRAQQGSDGSWMARIAFPGEGSLAVRVSQTPDVVAVQLAGSEALATRVRGALEGGGTRTGKPLTVSVAAVAAREEGDDHG